MCDCIKKVNEVLASRNTRLIVPITFSTKKTMDFGTSRVIITTEKLNRTKKEGPAKLFASFCPFCGEEYPD